PGDGLARRQSVVELLQLARGEGEHLSGEVATMICSAATGGSAWQALPPVAAEQTGSRVSPAPCAFADSTASAGAADNTRPPPAWSTPRPARPSAAAENAQSPDPRTAPVPPPPADKPASIRS